MPFALVLLPFGAALIAFALPSNRLRPLALPVVGLAHLVLSFIAIAGLVPVGRGEWLHLDPLGAVMLAVVSSLFTICALYAVPYLGARRQHSNRIFCACLLLFLSMTSLIILANHLGLLWVAIEATTLASAPLLYFHRNARSLEAAWK